MSLGLRTSAGETAGDSWRSAVSGADCLERLSLFESPRYGEKFAGLDKSLKDDFGRCAKILFSAVDEAMRGADISRIKKGRISVYLGTSIGGIFETENMIKNNAEKGVKNLSALSRYECSTLAELAAKRIGARGECAAFSTACSSSSLALAEGCNAVVQGDCDAALICGVDSLSRITVNGFGSLMLLSAGKCRPFDKNRDGINLGEAARRDFNRIVRFSVRTKTARLYFGLVLHLRRVSCNLAAPVGRGRGEGDGLRLENGFPESVGNFILQRPRHGDKRKRHRRGCRFEKRFCRKYSAGFLVETRIRSYPRRQRNSQCGDVGRGCRK